MVSVKLRRRDLAAFLRYLYRLEEIAESHGYDKRWNLSTERAHERLMRAAKA